MSRVVTDSLVRQVRERANFLCEYCRLPEIASSIDPATKVVTSLFNPRESSWGIHFELQGGEIVPLTNIGRATLFLLKMNLPASIMVRRVYFSGN